MHTLRVRTQRAFNMPKGFLGLTLRVLPATQIEPQDTLGWATELLGGPTYFKYLVTVLMNQIFVP